MPIVDKPELVFALAGPIGTDLHLLAQTLEESLTAYGYVCEQIRVSQLIQQFCDAELQGILSSAKMEERTRLLMAAGDAIRAQAGKGDGLIPVVVGAIRAAREDRLKAQGVEDATIPCKNTCYIIDSLKHPDEVETLRNVYGDNFVLLSGFSSPAERRAKITSGIAKSHMSTKDDTFVLEANKLIEVDSKRGGSRLGQSLRETFPLGDMFIRVSGEFASKLNRFLDLYFGSPYVTPRRDEFFMYEAKAKAYRSADLSRQIGAVIVDASLNLVASGCNEVPTVNGGSYWPDMADNLDNRDYKKERDFNAVKKVEIIEELVAFLSKEGVMKLPDNTAAEDAVRNLIFGDKKGAFKELRVSNLIEFGRVVHAEMNAITEAARRGVRVGGGAIFSTTFPCHMCARHIIAAGITRVVYIEPYPKSMTEELYGEIVSIDAEPTGSEAVPEAGRLADKVAFEPFEGVAPTLYRDLFQAGPRKDAQGYTLTWTKSTSTPKIARTSTAHLGLELAIVKAVEQLQDVGLKDVQAGMEG